METPDLIELPILTTIDLLGFSCFEHVSYSPDCIFLFLSNHTYHISMLSTNFTNKPRVLHICIGVQARSLFS